MISYEDIMNYCSNYKISEGNIIDKRNNQVVTDEDTILRVKSSILIYKDAKKEFDSLVNTFGSKDKLKYKDREHYIRSSMEKYSVNNEENNYGVNKFIRELLASNGHYENGMLGDDFLNSKFGIIIPPNDQLGIPYLRLKFRERRKI